jgi:glycosidase
MDWVQHGIWWHVYPLGFCGAPLAAEAGAGEPRLRRLLSWLDYAVELGVSGLMLGPVFESQTHGYDTLDHYRVDPRLGSDADLDDLIDACRTRGLRVVLDGVFSHVGDRHPLVLEAARTGFDGPAAEWLDIDRSAPEGPRPRVFEGHGSLVRLNHQVPQVVAYVADVMRHWLDRGIDGWRLDAAYSVAPEFWAAVLPAVRERHREAWVFGEVIHGDYAAFVEQSGVDSVTQYELWKAIWSSLVDRNFFELDWTLSRHNDLLEHVTPVTFVGNHDVTRIASAVGPDAAVVALAILMTVGGIPAVYYGDEQGWTGIKEDRAGGDDAIRPAFPAGPDRLAIEGADTFRAHQDLIGLRRRNAWLVTATTESIAITNTRYVYRARASKGAETLVVEVDVTDAPQIVIRNGDGGTLWQLGT